MNYWNSMFKKVNKPKWGQLEITFHILSKQIHEIYTWNVSVKADKVCVLRGKKVEVVI